MSCFHFPLFVVAAKQQVKNISYTIPTFKPSPLLRSIYKGINEVKNIKAIMNILNSLFFILFFCTCRGDRLGQLCTKDFDKSKSSNISANIDSLLAEFVSKTALTGYFATSSGNGPDEVYGLAQCRGDVSDTDCSSCIEDGAKQIRQLCPNQVDARIWYDYCFLRYDNEDFTGKIDTSYGIVYYNVDNVTDPVEFNKQLGALMDKIISSATMTKSEGLGKDQTKLSPFVTLYALVQCIRDISHIDCAQCLAIAVESFQTICSNRKGCRVLYSSCYVRYELYPFFFPLDSNNTSDGSTTSVVRVFL